MASDPTISMGAAGTAPTVMDKDDPDVVVTSEDGGQKVADMKEEDIISAITGDGKIDLKVDLNEDGSLTITESDGKSRTFEPGATISEDGTITGTSTQTQGDTETKFIGEISFIEKTKSGQETITKPLENGNTVIIERGTAEEPATWSQNDEGETLFEGKQTTTERTEDGEEVVQVFEGTSKSTDNGPPTFLTGTTTTTSSDGTVVTLAWSDGEAVSGDIKAPDDENATPLAKETLAVYSEGNEEAPDSDVEGEEDGSRVTD